MTGRHGREHGRRAGRRRPWFTDLIHALGLTASAHREEDPR